MFLDYGDLRARVEAGDAPTLEAVRGAVTSEGGCAGRHTLPQTIIEN